MSFNVGGLTLRASRMFTSLIMKLEPCGAHTAGLHWSPNSIALLLNAQMMLAEPLPFLFHIIHSAAPSVSALLILLMSTTHPQFQFYVYVYLSACVGWMDGWLGGWMDGWMDYMHLVSLHATVAYTNNTWPICIWQVIFVLVFNKEVDA